MAHNVLPQSPTCLGFSSILAGRFNGWLMVACVLVTVFQPAFAAPTGSPHRVRYRLVALGLPTGFTGCIPKAMNDRGWVVGELTLPYVPGGSPAGRAFVWHDGKFTILPMLPKYARGVANAINNAGVVVGTCDTYFDGAYMGTRSSAFLWADGKLSRLPDMPATGESAATAINDSGIIGGYTGNTADANMAAQSTTAFVLANGKRTDIGSGEVVGIDNANDIFGNAPNTTTYSPKPNSFITIGGRKAFIHGSSNFTDKDMGELRSVNHLGTTIFSRSANFGATAIVPPNYIPDFATLMRYADGRTFVMPDTATPIGENGDVGGWIVTPKKKRTAVIWLSTAHQTINKSQRLDIVGHKSVPLKYKGICIVLQNHLTGATNLALNYVVAINAYGAILCDARSLKPKSDWIQAALLVPVK